MSYSDDTIQHNTEGRPTMAQLIEQARRMPQRTWCDSCHKNLTTNQIIFGDGMTYWVCDECRPFDPSTIKVILNERPDLDDQIPPSY